MANFDQLLSCSVGGSGFILTGYTRQAEGVYNESDVRTATKVSFTLEGELTAASASALTTALGTLDSACKAGGDLTISVSGATRESLTAVSCIEGPRYKLAYGPEQGETLQQLTITVDAVSALDPNSDHVLSDTTTLATSVNVEGLTTLTWTGKIITDGTITATSVVTPGIGTPPVPKIPAISAGWQLTYSYQRNEDDTQCTWSATQVGLVAAYPGTLGDILEGEYTLTTACDENNRKLTTHSYDYVGAGALAYVQGRETALRNAGNLLRASVSCTTHKTRHATGQFEVLSARDSGTLLEQSETLAVSKSGSLLREQRYAGTTPLIVQESPACFIYEQNGRAVGLGVWPAPLAAFFNTNLMDGPEITYDFGNGFERIITWRYRFIFTTAQTNPTPRGRP